MQGSLALYRGGNRAFSEHNEAIGEVAATMSVKIMQENSCYLHDFTAHTQAFDVGVSVDGTWMKRGYSP